MGTIPYKLPLGPPHRRFLGWFDPGRFEVSSIAGRSKAVVVMAGDDGGGDRVSANRPPPTRRREMQKKLEQGYTPAKRMQEIACIAIASVLYAITVWRLVNEFDNSLLQVVTAVVVGMLVADFASGLVHWGADTWGSLDAPLVGQTFIRSFREHHIYPTAMCKHDFVETNGDNFLTVVPILTYTAFFWTAETSWFPGTSVLAFVVAAALFTAVTNQIHKWAHTMKPPAIVDLLQRAHVILPRHSHQVHHKNPFDRSYCITTGWLNEPLGAIGFWRRAETVISAVTGMVPREDDANLYSKAIGE